EDGIRDDLVTGVQTCALPIYDCRGVVAAAALEREVDQPLRRARGARLLRQHLADLVLRHVLADAVGAEQEAVAVGERHHERGDRSEERRVGREGRARWGWGGR